MSYDNYDWLGNYPSPGGYQEYQGQQGESRRTQSNNANVNATSNHNPAPNGSSSSSIEPPYPAPPFGGPGWMDTNPYLVPPQYSGSSNYNQMFDMPPQGRLSHIPPSPFRKTSISAALSPTPPMNYIAPYHLTSDLRNESISRYEPPSLSRGSIPQASGDIPSSRRETGHPGGKQLTKKRRHVDNHAETRAQDVLAQPGGIRSLSRVEDTPPPAIGSIRQPSSQSIPEVDSLQRSASYQSSNQRAPVAGSFQRSGSSHQSYSQRAPTAGNLQSGSSYQPSNRSPSDLRYSPLPPPSSSPPVQNSNYPPPPALEPSYEAPNRSAFNNLHAYNERRAQEAITLLNEQSQLPHQRDTATSTPMSSSYPPIPDTRKSSATPYPPQIITPPAVGPESTFTLEHTVTSRQQSAQYQQHEDQSQIHLPEPLLDQPAYQPPYQSVNQDEGKKQKQKRARKKSETTPRPAKKPRKTPTQPKPPASHHFVTLPEVETRMDTWETRQEAQENEEERVSLLSQFSQRRTPTVAKSSSPPMANSHGTAFSRATSQSSSQTVLGEGYPQTSVTPLRSTKTSVSSHPGSGPRNEIPQIQSSKPRQSPSNYTKPGQTPETVTVPAFRKANGSNVAAKPSSPLINSLSAGTASQVNKPPAKVSAEPTVQLSKTASAQVNQGSLNKGSIQTPAQVSVTHQSQRGSQVDTGPVNAPAKMPATDLNTAPSKIGAGAVSADMKSVPIKPSTSQQEGRVSSPRLQPSQKPSTQPQKVTTMQPQKNTTTQPQATPSSKDPPQSQINKTPFPATSSSQTSGRMDSPAPREIPIFDLTAPPPAPPPPPPPPPVSMPQQAATTPYASPYLPPSGSPRTNTPQYRKIPPTSHPPAIVPQSTPRSSAGPPINRPLAYYPPSVLPQFHRPPHPPHFSQNSAQHQIPRPVPATGTPTSQAPVPRSINSFPNVQTNNQELAQQRHMVLGQEFIPYPPPPPPPPPPPHMMEGFSQFAYQSADPAVVRQRIKSRNDIARPLKLADALEKKTYDPKTIARDILIASGRHPTEAPLNHHLFGLREHFTHVDHNSDLDSFRWDLVDNKESREFPRRVGAHVPPVTASPIAAPPVAAPVSAATRPPQLPVPPPVRVQQPQLQSQSQPQSQPSQKSQSQPQVQPPAPARRSAVAVVAPPPTSTTVAPSRRPSVRVSPASPPVPVAVAVAVPAPSPSRSSVSRTPSKPKSKPRPTIEVAIPAMKTQGPFNVYKCEWGSCQAELHNLDTLAQHVLKMHIPYTLQCAWKGCTNTTQMSAAPLYKHMKADHADKLAWKLGDGPSVPRTDSLGPESKSNSSPMMITPEAQLGESGEQDTLVLPASYKSIRAFNRLHHHHSQQKKATQILRAVQRMKERIGVGLDAGGCKLATPVRNANVSNDEGVFELVDCEALDE